MSYFSWVGFYLYVFSIRPADYIEVKDALVSYLSNALQVIFQFIFLLKTTISIGAIHINTLLCFFRFNKKDRHLALGDSCYQDRCLNIAREFRKYPFLMLKIKF